MWLDEVIYRAGEIFLLPQRQVSVTGLDRNRLASLDVRPVTYSPIGWHSRPGWTAREWSVVAVDGWTTP